MAVGAGAGVADRHVVGHGRRRRIGHALVGLSAGGRRRFLARTQVGVDLDARGRFGGAADRADVDRAQARQIGRIGRDLAVGVHRPALKIQAGAVLQIALLVDGEGAGAGEQARVRRADVLGLRRRDEEALTVDGEVGAGCRALKLTFLADVGAGVGGDAAGRIAAARGGLAVDQGLELARRALVADGVHVGDVLGDRRQGGGVGGQAGHAGQHCTVEAHGRTLLK